MPYYKMNGKKDGKQKYRVRINYIDRLGNKKQLDRAAYGLEEAKQLERELNYQIKREKELPASSITLQKLYDEYTVAKRHEVRETSLDKTQRILKRYVLEEYGDLKLDKLNVPIVQKWKHSIEELSLGITTRQNIYTAHYKV